ncbi:hypothetical protein DFH94DRAFT_759034 [Russula ochroleuca]|uniref:Uncharacterized protein n=1 Tax=Russula ochroleuca TaxID=152965 RepID=A0A9P5MRY7_9AGAM|nr:hypothetical protein DFH94DRAFT_759034 [Russula ochroleuca]
MTEPPSRQERTSPSSVPHTPVPPKHASATPHRLPAPPERAASRQDRTKDPSSTPHRLPVPLEHTLASKGPPLQGHKDQSAAPHRPSELTPATTEPLRQERNPSFVPYRLPVPPEHASATTESPWQGRKDPSTTPHRPPAPPEHTYGLIATQPRLELNRPLAIGIQESAGPRQVTPSDDGSSGEGPRGLPGGGRRLGEGEPRGGGRASEQPVEGRTARGRPPEQLGRRGPEGRRNLQEPPGDALVRPREEEVSTGSWICCMLCLRWFTGQVEHHTNDSGPHAFITEIESDERLPEVPSPSSASPTVIEHPTVPPPPPALPSPGTSAPLSDNTATHVGPLRQGQLNVDTGSVRPLVEPWVTGTPSNQIEVPLNLTTDGPQEQSYATPSVVSSVPPLGLEQIVSVVLHDRPSESSNRNLTAATTGPPGQSSAHTQPVQSSYHFQSSSNSSQSPNQQNVSIQPHQSQFERRRLFILRDRCCDCLTGCIGCCACCCCCSCGYYC